MCASRVCIPIASLTFAIPTESPFAKFSARQYYLLYGIKIFVFMFEHLMVFAVDLSISNFVFDCCKGMGNSFFIF